MQDSRILVKLDWIFENLDHNKVCQVLERLYNIAFQPKYEQYHKFMKSGISRTGTFQRDSETETLKKSITALLNWHQSLQHDVATFQSMTADINHNIFNPLGYDGTMKPERVRTEKGGFVTKFIFEPIVPETRHYFMQYIHNHPKANASAELDNLSPPRFPHEPEPEPHHHEPPQERHYEIVEDSPPAQQPVYYPDPPYSPDPPKTESTPSPQKPLSLVQETPEDIREQFRYIEIEHERLEHEKAILRAREEEIEAERHRFYLEKRALSHERENFQEMINEVRSRDAYDKSLVHRANFFEQQANEVQAYNRKLIETVNRHDAEKTRLHEAIQRITVQKDESEQAFNKRRREMEDELQRSAMYVQIFQERLNDMMEGPPKSHMGTSTETHTASSSTSMSPEAKRPDYESYMRRMKAHYEREMELGKITIDEYKRRIDEYGKKPATTTAATDITPIKTQSKAAETETKGTHEITTQVTPPKPTFKDILSSSTQMTPKGQHVAATSTDTKGSHEIQTQVTPKRQHSTSTQAPKPKVTHSAGLLQCYEQHEMLLTGTTTEDNIEVTLSCVGAISGATSSNVICLLENVNEIKWDGKRNTPLLPTHYRLLFSLLK